MKRLQTALFVLARRASSGVRSVAAFPENAVAARLPELDRPVRLPPQKRRPQSWNTANVVKFPQPFKQWSLNKLVRAAVSDGV